MMGRALLVWLAILVLASLNGMARQAWLIPNLGQGIGRAVSTLILCGVVSLVTWTTIGWIAPDSTRHALMIGVLWLLLTLAFEFLVGHYVFGTSWSTLLEDHDVSRGRIWPAVLLLVLLAPWLTFRLRR
jgi:hypothetical protein